MILNSKQNVKKQSQNNNKNNKNNHNNYNNINNNNNKNKKIILMKMKKDFFLEVFEMMKVQKKLEGYSYKDGQCQMSLVQNVYNLS